MRTKPSTYSGGAPTPSSFFVEFDVLANGRAGHFNRSMLSWGKSGFKLSGCCESQCWCKGMYHVLRYAAVVPGFVSALCRKHYAGATSGSVAALVKGCKLYYTPCMQWLL